MSLAEDMSKTPAFPPSAITDSSFVFAAEPNTTTDGMLPNASAKVARTAAASASTSDVSLTLILAATPSLGIGNNGALPWPQLRKEMAYFKRVTTRIPSSSAPSRVSSSENHTQTGLKKSMNAVVMGRKTWDSIPPRFRPLAGRVNIVVTRGVEQFMAREKDGFAKRSREGKGAEGPIAVGGLEEAVARAREFGTSPPASSGHMAEETATSTNTKDGTPERVQHHSYDAGSRPEPIHIPRIFVIGGSALYSLALAHPLTQRILLTKIEKEYECDTFFPIDVEKDGSGWRKAGPQELIEWTGDEAGGRMEEAGVRFEFGMWERA